MADGTVRIDHGKPKCGGPRKHGAGPCTRPAGWGTSHAGVGRCKLHGGSTPSHVKAGAAALAEQETRAVLAQLDVPPVNDPLTALAELAGQVVAWQRALAEKVNELTALRFEDDKGAEQLHSHVALYERAMDRCGTVLATMAKLNIDERLARITEQQADRVIAAIDAALELADVDITRRGEAKLTVARLLREAA